MEFLFIIWSLIYIVLYCPSTSEHPFFKSYAFYLLIDSLLFLLFLIAIILYHYLNKFSEYAYANLKAGILLVIFIINFEAINLVKEETCEFQNNFKQFYSGMILAIIILNI